MRALSLLLLLLLVVESRADEPIRLLREFSLSPDGAEIYFAWRGDIWSHPVQGGSAKRLTAHPAIERFPRLSPDGKTLAFVSNRTGANQVYTMPVAGGDPKQQTHHSEGSLVSDWYPDGRAMLIKGNRDNFWRAGDRYFRRVLDGSSDRMLFDGYGHSAQVSPDGKQLLFCREGVSWTRKGYRGPQSCQIWLFDFASRVFTRQTEGDFGERSPVWTPDASGYFFTAQRDGAFNLFRRQLESGQTVQLTRFKDDGVLFPVLSRNGAVIVFRVGFDLIDSALGHLQVVLDEQLIQTVLSSAVDLDPQEVGVAWRPVGGEMRIEVDAVERFGDVVAVCPGSGCAVVAAGAGR